jgi:hypothetical protein
MSAVLTSLTISVVPPTVLRTLVFHFGPPGKTQYQSYLDTTTDDPPLSEAAWSAPASSIPDWIAALTSITVTDEELVIVKDGSTYKSILNKQV